MITGAFLVLAFWIFCFTLWRESKGLGLSQEKVIDVSLLIAFFGLLGARIVFVIEHWSIFQPSFVRVVLLLKYPGVSVIGLVISSFIAIIFYSKSLKLKPFACLDFFSLPAIFFIIVSLLSCFGANCSVVKISTLPVILICLIVISLVFHYIKVALISNPAFSRIASRPGFIFLLTTIALLGSGLVLAKGLPHRVYSYSQGLIILTVLAFSVRYYFLFKVIKIPQSVLGQIRDYLEKRRSDTEHRLAQLKKEDPNSDKGRLHEEKSDDDTATEKASHERTAALQVQLNKTLIEIRKALTKIKVGTYGNCENCGKMIDTDRLAAMPSATLCMDCERKKEKGHK